MLFFSKATQDDEDLLALLRQNSEEAFTVIYERYLNCCMCWPLDI